MYILSYILLGLMSMLLAVHCQDGLQDCSVSREAYVNLTLGPAEDMPLEFSSGVEAQICRITSQTCCPLTVEQSINDAAFANIKEKMPAYVRYLNESDRHFFSSYGFVTDVVIDAIRDYFELSVQANADNIRAALNRITRQLDNIQLNSGVSSFQARMRDLFSSSYLERMRGLYDLNPTGDYNNSFTGCAMAIIEENQISDEITGAIDIMEYHFRSLYYFREILFGIYIVFSNLENNLPFTSCIRSFAELFYCHICLPETATLFPCRNVCKNVLSGCTIFLHVTGEEIVLPLRVLCQLNTLTTDASWSLHTALQVINNKLYSIFDASVSELLEIESNISSCSEAPPLAAVPTPTDNPNRTTIGRAELLSNVPTSLTSSLHNILVDNLSSIFLDFENITQNILNNECGSFPGDNDSTDFECWRRLSTSVTDVDFLGIDFQAVLFRNQDLSPPGASFVSMFNTSVERMKTNATQAMQFIDNIPAELKVSLDHCNLSLSQILLPRPTIMPTPCNSTDTTPSNNADMTPSNNADMTPSNNADMTPSNNADMTSSNNADMTPSNNADMTPSNNAEMTPSNNADMTPSNNADMTASNNADMTPSNNADMTPSNNADMTASNNADMTPSNNADMTPSNNADMTASNNADMTPSNNADMTPSNNADMTASNNADMTPSNNADMTPSNNADMTASNNADMTPSNNADMTPSNNADMTPTTTLTELTQSTVGTMSSTPTSTERPDAGSAKQTGLSTGLLLLPIVVSLFLIFRE